MSVAEKSFGKWLSGHRVPANHNLPNEHMCVPLSPRQDAPDVRSTNCIFPLACCTCGIVKSVTSVRLRHLSCAIQLVLNRLNFELTQFPGSRLPSLFPACCGVLYAAAASGTLLVSFSHCIPTRLDEGVIPTLWPLP